MLAALMAADTAGRAWFMRNAVEVFGSPVAKRILLMFPSKKVANIHRYIMCTGC